MSLRTRCPNCQTTLKVPESAGTKRLKCPKCETKFFPEPDSGGTSGRRPTSSGAVAGIPEARPASSQTQPAVPDELPLPNITKDLRESFDLPLLADDEPSALTGSSAGGLLEDLAPAPRRKKSTAEARSQPRRCSCGSVVPAGMSLCSRCGLDLDTGTRIDVEELLEPTVTLPPAPGAPMGVLFVGITTLLVSVCLAFVSLYLYFSTPSGSRSWGYLLLTLVCGFGVFAAVRFLQGRSARFLLITLLLGGAIDLVTMVVLPISVPGNPLITQTPGEAPPKEETIDLGPYGPAAEDEAAYDLDVPVIAPLTERINWRQVYTGLILLMLTSAVAVYLMSPPVRRYFERRRMSALPQLGPEHI